MFRTKCDKRVHIVAPWLQNYECVVCVLHVIYKRRPRIATADVPL